MKKIMYKLSLICLFPALLLLPSCESVAPDAQEPFSIELSLKNSQGLPLSGYIVSICPKDCINGFWYDYDKVHGTTIGFDTVETYRVEIYVKDYFAKHVRNLDNRIFEPGHYTMRWYCRNDDGTVVRDGIYRIGVNYYDSADSLQFSDSSLAYKFSEHDMSQAPYVTDQNGKIISSDIIPFPMLYCKEKLEFRDEYCNMMGDFDFSTSSRTMIVLVSSPEGEVRECFFDIKNTKNILNLNWDKLDVPEYKHNLKNIYDDKDRANLDSNALNYTKDVELASLTANVTAEGTVKITWTVENETEMLGYRIYRSDTPDLSSAILISDYIEAVNTPWTAYTYIDSEADFGITYYYWLESVDVYGNSLFHGPVIIIIDEPEVPPNEEHNRFYPNYPNPFN